MRQRSRAAAAVCLLIVGSTASIVASAGVSPGAARVVGLPAYAVTAHAVQQSPKQIAAAAYARMTRPERIGQLFMIGVDPAGPDASTLQRLEHWRIGNLILDKDSSAGVKPTANVDAQLRTATTVAGIAPWISTDQEGGEVQRLTGPGFAQMPTALAQGQLPTRTLRSDFGTWGGELRRAGVNLDLAPVADVVPAKHAQRNPSIGRYDREYGHRPGPVGRHVVAVIRGLRDANVSATVKHFPGLGRASGDTDTQRHVTDPTTRHDPYLKSFAAAIDARPAVVMVSSATYPAIDPHHVATFSHTVITGMLRHQFGFRGPVISDSMTAVALDHVPAAERATKFVAAGGDIVLVGSLQPVAAMRRALLGAASRDSVVSGVMKTAVMRVLIAKARAGLISN